MSNSAFNVSSFRPVDTKLVLINSSQVDVSFSSAFSTSISVDLQSEEGGAFSENQNGTTDGQSDSAVSFTGFPPDQDLLCRITVTGEDGSDNLVHVSIDW
jgi:hypothetical protein